jgi:hypothetical protein
MPLIAFVLLAIVCLALIGFACACLSDQPMQAVERALSMGTGLLPLIEVWALVLSVAVASVFVNRVRPASGRASPQLLQCFLF